MTMRSVKRKIRFIYQKVTLGFSDRDTWNLDYTMAKFLLPRLIRYKQICDCCPSRLDVQEWNLILEKIIRSMEIVSGEFSEYTIDSYSEEVQEGCDLLGKYFTDLWW